MMGVFPSTKTFLLLVVLTTFMFSARIITHPVPRPVAQGQQYPFLTNWGHRLWKFRQPLDIAINSDDNVHATDNKRVESDTNVCS